MGLGYSGGNEGPKIQSTDCEMLKITVRTRRLRIMQLGFLLNDSKLLLPWRYITMGNDDTVISSPLQSICSIYVLYNITAGLFNTSNKTLFIIQGSTWEPAWKAPIRWRQKVCSSAKTIIKMFCYRSNVFQCAGDPEMENLRICSVRNTEEPPHHSESR